MPSSPSTPRHRSAGVDIPGDGVTHTHTHTHLARIVASQHTALTSRPPGRRQQSYPHWSAAGEGADRGDVSAERAESPFPPQLHSLCIPLLSQRPSGAVSPPITEGNSQCFGTHREVWEEGAVQGGEPSARGQNAAQRRLRPLQPCREHRNVSTAPSRRGPPAMGQHGAVMRSCRDPQAPLTLLLGADDLLQQPTQPPVPPAAKVNQCGCGDPTPSPYPLKVSPLPHCRPSTGTAALRSPLYPDPPPLPKKPSGQNHKVPDGAAAAAGRGGGCRNWCGPRWGPEGAAKPTQTQRMQSNNKRGSAPSLLWGWGALTRHTGPSSTGPRGGAGRAEPPIQGGRDPSDRPQAE